MDAGPDHTGEPRVRAIIVDDTEAIRRLLRVSFDGDPRFEILGEAANGVEAIELAGRLQPDLVILDWDMPVLGGMEALPEIHERAPHAVVVVYTAGADAGTYRAAVAAGAVDVLDKAAAGPSLVDEVSRILVAHWTQPSAPLDLRIGPVPAEAARRWVANTREILAAVRRHPDRLPSPVALEDLDQFDALLRSWDEYAARSERFCWVARAETSDVERLVERWAVLDAMSDELLASLGVSWAPPEARPFYLAIRAGVFEALAAQATTQALAERLRRQWEARSTPRAGAPDRRPDGGVDRRTDPGAGAAAVDLRADRGATGDDGSGPTLDLRNPADRGPSDRLAGAREGGGEAGPLDPLAPADPGPV